MTASGRNIKQGPLYVKTVRGQPYQIAGRTLVPEARIISFGKAKATIEPERFGGWGIGFVRTSPVALIEIAKTGERRIPITDTSFRVTLGLITATAGIVLLFGAVRRLAGLRQSIPEETAQ